MAGTPDIAVSDIQLSLMAAYIQIRREAESEANRTNHVIRQGRAAERAHHAAEAEAWRQLAS